MYSISERRIPSTRKPRTNNNQMDEKSLLGLVFIIAALVLVVWWSDTFVELLFSIFLFFFNSIPFQLLAFIFLFLVVRPFTSREKERKRRITRTYMYTYIQPNGERSSTLNDIQGRLPSQPNRYEAGVKYIRGEIYPAEPRSPG